MASASQLDLVRSIGADEVIDYTKKDVTDGTRQWEVIIDTGGRRRLSQLRRALTPTGTLVIVGGEGGGRWMGGFLRNLRAPLVSLFVGQRLRMLVSKRTRTTCRCCGSSSRPAASPTRQRGDHLSLEAFPELGDRVEVHLLSHPRSFLN